MAKKLKPVKENAVKVETNAVLSVLEETQQMRIAFMVFLMQFVARIPYKWGGASPLEGLDCSGAVQIFLDYWGLDPKGDQTAQGLFDHFYEVSEPVKDLGALVFYGQGPEKITHVGMMLNSHQVVEAAGGGSSTVNLQTAVKQNAYIRVRKFDYRDDVVAILKPYGLPW